MLRRLRHLHDLSFREFLIFAQLVLLAATVRISLSFLPLPRLLTILSAAATNRFLRQFPFFHRGFPRRLGGFLSVGLPFILSVGAQRRSRRTVTDWFRNGGVSSSPALWKRGDRGDFSLFLPHPDLLPHGRRNPQPYAYIETRLLTLTNLAARAVRRDGPCLLRSLMLLWLLNARGQEAELLIGVNKEGETLQAHAWVETQGTTSGDSVEMTTSFVILVRL